MVDCLLYQNFNIFSLIDSDTTWGLLRGLKATPLKGDSERSERQRDEVPMNKIVHERKRMPILSFRVCRIFLIFILVGASSGSLLAEDLSKAKEGVNGQIELAEKYFYQGDFDKALEAYEGIQKIYPNNSEIWFKLAKITLEKSEYKKAEEYLNQALEINPNNLDARYYLAGIFSLYGKYKQTIEECLRVLKIEPEFYQARLLLADAYAFEFDTKNTEVELKRLAAITPHSGSIHYRLANQYSVSGDYAKAISELELALKLNSDISTLWRDLGVFYERSYNFPKAIESYGRAILLNPQDVWSHFGLGQAYQGLQQNEEALKHYKIVLDKHPNHFWVLQGILSLYYQIQDYHHLLEVSKKALEFYPSEPEFNFYLGAAYYLWYALEGKTEYLDKANAQFHAVLKINPNHVNAKVWLEQISKLEEQKQSPADKLKNTQTLPHYIIKTDMDINSNVIQRLIKEERAERIFADVQAFLGEQFGKTVEVEPIKLSIFTKRDDFKVSYESCGCSDPGEARGFFNPSANLIAIDSESVQDYFIEYILFHETMHAILSKYIPNPPFWLNEGLAGSALSHLHWQMGADDLTKILSSSQFATLDIKAILDNKQEDSYIYHLWVYFLLKEQPQALKEYLKLFQENNKELATEVFLKDITGLTDKFKAFLRSLEEKMLIFDDFKTYEFDKIAHQFGHPQIKAEDILLVLMMHPPTYKAVSRVFFLENNISFQDFSSLIRKERQPFYAGLSEEAERLLGLAAKKSQKKEKPFITTDEYLLAILEDGQNDAAQLLKDRGVNIKDLYQRFVKAMEDLRSEKDRFFMVFPKTVLPGCKVKLFYRLLPEDRIELEKISSEKDEEKLRKAYAAQREEIERKAVKVFLNNLLLRSLHTPHYYSKTDLSEEALIIPKNQPLGEFKLEIKKEDKNLYSIPLTITDKLPTPLINKITAYPFLPEEGLMQNLSRLKIETNYWDKSFIPQVTFRQKDKSFLVQGKAETSRYGLDDLSDVVYADIPPEILPGEVEVSLQAKLDEKISPARPSVSMKVFEQEPPEIISLNKYTFSLGEKVLIKGKNFALEEGRNEVFIGSWQGYGAIKKEDYLSSDVYIDDEDKDEWLFDLVSSYTTQTLEIQVPQDINLKGKLPLKIKVFDQISKEVFIELQQ